MPFQWGTASAACGAAASSLLFTRLLPRDQAHTYVETARRQRDYVLGANPFDISCLVGAGSHYSLNPHHQIADLKGVELVGALVGGPADAATIRKEKFVIEHLGIGSQALSLALESEVPDDAAAFNDLTLDYVTNEPAIDYTATFLLIAALFQST